MQTEMQTALILIRLFLFRPVLFSQKNCKVAAGCESHEINFKIYKTHIKPKKPAFIKPVKPAGLGFMIKPGFYANPDIKEIYHIVFITKMVHVMLHEIASQKLLVFTLYVNPYMSHWVSSF